jgi:hypothetical protein
MSRAIPRRIVADIGGQHTGVFFTRTGLVAVDPTSGKVLYQYRWRARQAASVNAATPVISNDRIFPLGELQHRRRAAPGREQQASSRSGRAMNRCRITIRRACLKDGYLYGFDGRQEFGQTLRCVELATGKVMWNVDGFGAGTLLIAGDTLVITRESGELALAAASPKAFRFNARAQLIKGVVRRTRRSPTAVTTFVTSASLLLSISERNKATGITEPIS